MRCGENEEETGSGFMGGIIRHFGDLSTQFLIYVGFQ